jgi:hypothetical protein
MASDSPCELCTNENWPSLYPKPSCRIKIDLERSENPVTQSVYRDILRNREKDEVEIPCPMIRLNQRKEEKE